MKLDELFEDRYEHEAHGRNVLEDDKIDEALSQVAIITDDLIATLKKAGLDASKAFSSIKAAVTKAFEAGKEAELEAEKAFQ